MDALNLQPDALGTTDTTFEVEGYEDFHIVEWDLFCIHSGNMA